MADGTEGLVPIILEHYRLSLNHDLHLTAQAVQELREAQRHESLGFARPARAANQIHCL
jgi:hypothetical protein